MGRCGECFAERGVPWKPWNLSGSATVHNSLLASLGAYMGRTGNLSACDCELCNKCKN